MNGQLHMSCLAHPILYSGDLGGMRQVPGVSLGVTTFCLPTLRPPAFAVCKSCFTMPATSRNRPRYVTKTNKLSEGVIYHDTRGTHWWLIVPIDVSSLFLVGVVLKLGRQVSIGDSSQSNCLHLVRFKRRRKRMHD